MVSNNLCVFCGQKFICRGTQLNENRCRDELQNSGRLKWETVAVEMPKQKLIELHVVALWCWQPGHAVGPYNAMRQGELSLAKTSQRTQRQIEFRCVGLKAPRVPTISPIASSLLGCFSVMLLLPYTEGCWFEIRAKHNTRELIPTLIDQKLERLRIWQIPCSEFEFSVPEISTRQLTLLLWWEVLQTIN